MSLCDISDFLIFGLVELSRTPQSQPERVDGTNSIPLIVLLYFSLDKLDVTNNKGNRKTKEKYETSNSLQVSLH